MCNSTNGNYGQESDPDGSCVDFTRVRWDAYPCKYKYKYKFICQVEYAAMNGRKKLIWYTKGITWTFSDSTCGISTGLPARIYWTEKYTWGIGYWYENYVCNWMINCSPPFNFFNKHQNQTPAPWKGSHVLPKRQNQSVRRADLPSNLLVYADHGKF